mgnify:CR=1 FL=1
MGSSNGFAGGEASRYIADLEQRAAPDGEQPQTASGQQ